jgi:hypothetical protein
MLNILHYDLFFYIWIFHILFNHAVDLTASAIALAIGPTFFVVTPAIEILPFFNKYI